jgi:hypothetical protein
LKLHLGKSAPFARYLRHCPYCGRPLRPRARFLGVGGQGVFCASCVRALRVLDGDLGRMGLKVAEAK